MISTDPKFKLKLHCLKFSFKNHFLPTMADDHTSEASGWLRNERLQKYCEYLYRQTDAIIHDLAMTCFFLFCHMQTVLMAICALWER